MPKFISKPTDSEGNVLSTEKYVKDSINTNNTTIENTYVKKDDLPNQYVTNSEQTTSSTSDGGSNIYTFYNNDGSTSSLTVYNGTKGSTGPQGPKGDTGPQGPAGQNATTTAVATTSANGLMSSTMVTKLNGITESADSVSFSRSLTSGAKVGTITINGTGTDLYAPTNTDTHVNTTLATTTKAYLLGTSTTPTSTATGVTAVADTGVYLDTTAGKLTATTFSGALSGNASTATKLATARNINNTSFDGSSNIKLSSGYTWWVGGSDTSSNTNGYYKFLTKTMNTYEDFNISLYITNEYLASANGIFQIHVRNTNSTTTTPAPNVFNWLIRRNWAEDSIIAVVNGLTIDFYIKQTVTQYGGICFTVISESNRKTITTYTPVSSTVPTTGLTATTTSTDAGQVSLATTATTATALSSDSAAGSATQPVYFSSSGKPTACSYTLAKSVPSTAVFTDTNTKVNVTLGTTTKAYLLGTSTTPTSTTTGVTAISDTGVYLDTTAGKLTATTFSGALSGNASTATKLATARKINNTSFDGSADIRLSSGHTWWVGTDAESSSGYYKFLTKTMIQYEDFNMTLCITNEYNSIMNGIFQIHVRNDSASTTSAPNVFCWLVRRGWSSDSIIAVVKGLTIDFYINQTISKYGGICFTVISESSRRSSTSYTPVSSTSPTTGLTATKTSYDSGQISSATYSSQTNTTTSANYRLLMSGNANDTDEYQIARKSANFYANPSTGCLTAGMFKGTYTKLYDTTVSSTSVTITISNLLSYSILFVSMGNIGGSSTAGIVRRYPIAIQNLNAGNTDTMFYFLGNGTYSKTSSSSVYISVKKASDTSLTLSSSNSVVLGTVTIEALL